MDIVGNALVAGPHKTQHHIVSHPAQADHAYFHGTLPIRHLMQATEQLSTDSRYFLAQLTWNPQSAGGVKD
jgi:hypothetical protein